MKYRDNMPEGVLCSTDVGSFWLTCPSGRPPRLLPRCKAILSTHPGRRIWDDLGLSRGFPSSRDPYFRGGDAAWYDQSSIQTGISVHLTYSSLLVSLADLSQLISQAIFNFFKILLPHHERHNDNDSTGGAGDG